MINSTQTLFLFGCLPFVYYVFAYATTVYSDVLYSGADRILFHRTGPVLCGVSYCLPYSAPKENPDRVAKSMLEAELKQSGVELESLRHVETRAAIYQHNMRHHLTAINAFLSADDVQQAEAYIKAVQTDVEAITPRRFCENELVNLLCSAFLVKAEQQGVSLNLETKLPRKLTISDTELWSILSNGLGNALYTVSKLERADKWSTLYCGVRFQ